MIKLVPAVLVLFLAARSDAFDKKKHAFMALVLVEDDDGQYSYFSGVILNDKFILTSASNLYPIKDIARVKVYVGDADVTSKDTVAYRAVKKHFSTEYDDTMRPFQYENLGLLELEKHLKMSYKVKPISMARYPPDSDDEKKVVAFGYNDEGKVVPVEGVTIQDVDCEDTFNNLLEERQVVNIFNPKVVCANFSQPNVNVCHGAAGGPLVDVAHNMMVGVAIAAQPDCQYKSTLPVLFYKFDESSNIAEMIEQLTGFGIELLEE